MSNKVKDINIKSRKYYFFNDIINIENFYPNNIKIDEKSSYKYSYVLYWLCDDQKIHKTLWCKSFVPYFK